MSSEIATAPVKNRGWQVTFAGLGINLALGVLYTWSVISKGIPDEWNWSEADKSWPYSIACLVFCLVMVPAGRMQDKLGPRLVATIGGILVGAGFLLASMTTSSVGYMVGFGLLAGAGIGFAYASATPPAVKWFPAARTGLIAGLVVSGFGLASVYAAPLARWLIQEFGVPTMTFTLGVAFLVIVAGLAQLLVPPPKGFRPVVPAPTTGAVSAARPAKEDFTPKEMLSTLQFYLLWFMYACGAGAGLMVISKLAKIGELQANIENGAILVVAMAVGNGAGRIVAGTASDKLGRGQTMLGCFLLQAFLIFLLSITREGTILANVPVLCLVSALIGANYGANLSLFPSVTKDYYGLKNFGVNYGLVFTAWGVGGFMLALGAGKLYDAFQTFAFAYYGAIGLLVLAALCTFVVKQPHRAADEETLATPAVETA
jgi:OFA family oxalate/formate antiporter-like MFS transporter